MKQLVPVSVFFASLVVVGAFPADSDAWGLTRRSSCCETAPCAAPCEVAQPAPVKMVERQVTRYRPEWKEQEVTVNVCKIVPREEKYTYSVSVPITKQETRKVTTYQRTTREVEYNYTVLVPKTYQEKRTVTYCEMETKMVKETVPVCRMVAVQTVDECGRCCVTCRPVTENVEVTRCVRTPVYKTKDVMVNLVKCESQARVGKKCVVDCVPVVKDVTVNVCSYERQERTGVRTVCDYKTEAVKRMVKTCTMVPYTETIRVPECPVSSCASCESDCGHRRHSLISRGGHGCCY
jgi:hypothetical protein